MGKQSFRIGQYSFSLRYDVGNPEWQHHEAKVYKGLYRDAQPIEYVETIRDINEVELILKCRKYAEDRNELQPFTVHRKFDVL